MFQKKNLKFLYFFLLFTLTLSYVNCSSSSFGVANTSKLAGVSAASTSEQSLVLNCSSAQEQFGNQCVSRCGSNESRNAVGICIVNAVIPPVTGGGPVVPQCNDSQEIFNNVCVAKCGSNQTRDFSGTCVNNCNLASNEIVNGQCVVRCGSNQTRNSSGVCITNACTNGAIDAGSCMNCGSSKHMNGTSTSCVSNYRDCSPQPANTTGGYQEWLNGGWDAVCKGFNCVSTHENVNGSCVARCAVGFERVNGSCVAQCAMQEERINGVCSVVYTFRSMSFEYDNKIVASTRFSPNDTRTITESANKIKRAYLNVDASYDEISRNDVMLISAVPEETMPASASLTECSRQLSTFCRTRSLNTNSLIWSLESGENTALFPDGSKNWLCVNTGQSVAEKRGLVDCGATAAAGPVLFMISNSDLKPRGTLLFYGSGAEARGSFKIRANITNSTTGFENYAGRFAEMEVQIKNRIDIHLSVNQDIFFGYGVPVLSVETITLDNGFVDNVTFKAISCAATTNVADRPTIAMSKRQYENRFDFDKAALAALPESTSTVKSVVTVNCNIEMYDGQTATARKDFVK